MIGIKLIFREIVTLHGDFITTQTGGIAPDIQIPCKTNTLKWHGYKSIQ